jgi:hypothetical protein
MLESTMPLSSCRQPNQVTPSSCVTGDAAPSTWSWRIMEPLAGGGGAFDGVANPPSPLGTTALPRLFGRAFSPARVVVAAALPGVFESGRIVEALTVVSRRG